MSKIILDEKIKSDILKMNPEDVYDKFTDDLDGLKVLFWINEICKTPRGFIYRENVIKNDINQKWIDFYLKNRAIVEQHKDMFFIDGLSPESIAYVQELIPNGVLSHQTALIIHNLCNLFHDVIFISVSNDYDETEIKKIIPNVRFCKVSEEFMDLGKQEITLSAGEKVNVYDVERTICDILMNIDILEREVFDDAINKYFNSDIKDLNKLFKYAKNLGIETEMHLLIQKYKSHYE